VIKVLPGLAWIRGYERAWLRGDLLAGLTVAAYLVPQVMAYAGLAGLPPVTGLWAILAPLAVYALLGSSRQMSVGPESTTALMTATVVAPLAAGDPGRYATLAATLPSSSPSSGGCPGCPDRCWPCCSPPPRSPSSTSRGTGSA
jgi:sulfate permease, SulP family